MCIDGIKRLCHIRGKMRKKVWVNTVGTSKQCLTLACSVWASVKAHLLFSILPFMQGDIILVGLRDYQDEKADVILK